MSELNERRWAVLSERGVEAKHLTYREAIDLVSRLGAERVHGRSIVTDEAAARVKTEQAAFAGEHAR